VNHPQATTIALKIWEEGVASSRFRDFARLDTTGANLHPKRSPLGTLDAYGLQVWIKAAARAIVRMRNIIAELGRLATDFATFSHDFPDLRTVKSARATITVDKIQIDEALSKLELITNRFP
jgi:hypothetical protein